MEPARGAHRIPRDAWRALRVRGSDARAWLHRVLSNDVRRLRPGDGAWNLLLDDRGRIQALGLLLCEGEQAFALWCDEPQREVWRAKLDFFLFAERVELLEDDATNAIEVLGSEAPHALEELAGAPPPAERGAHRDALIAGAPLRVVRADRGWTPSYLLLCASGDRARIEAALDERGCAREDEAWLQRLHVREGVAGFATDLADGVRPAEAGLAYAFDLDKGCYPGQETVARMDTYGGPPRRLFLLELDPRAALPAPGTRILHAGSEIGRTGSAAHDPSAAQSHALALIAKKAWSPGLDVELEGGTRAVLRELPR
jgi:folate-binding protein YgfZ